MAKRTITFNDDMFRNDNLTVSSYSMIGTVLTCNEYSSHRQGQISLGVDDTMALAVHLMEEVKGHIDPQVLISHAKAMIADAEARLPHPEPQVKPQGYTALTPQAKTILQHMRRAGSISAREAMNDYGIATTSLTRRIVDIEEAGFEVVRSKKTHPITTRDYTRYTLNEA